VFKGMEAHGYVPSVITFNMLIKGLCRNGRMNDVVNGFLIHHNISILHVLTNWTGM